MGVGTVKLHAHRRFCSLCDWDQALAADEWHRAAAALQSPSTLLNLNDALSGLWSDKGLRVGGRWLLGVELKQEITCNSIHVRWGG
jgi:hypothetical protein